MRLVSPVPVHLALGIHSYSIILMFFLLESLDIWSNCSFWITERKLVFYFVGPPYSPPSIRSTSRARPPLDLLPTKFLELRYWASRRLLICEYGE